MSPYSTFIDYDSGRDGQIAISTITLTDSAGATWFDATGISHILLTGEFAGGTTTITVDQGREGTGSPLHSVTGITSASVAAQAGAEVAITYKFVRIRIVQTVGATTNAQLAVKGEAR